MLDSVTDSGKPIIELRGVSKAFQSPGGSIDLAIEDVSFSETEGELYCLLGPSGCGKTTILNIVAGFVKPTQGIALVDGNVVKGPGPDRAMVFQNYALLPWMSVRANVELGLTIQGLKKDEREERIKEYLSLVALYDSGDKYPHQLSGGMQQRVSIARALALNPITLLMDEPFGGLDAYTRMAMQDELIRIWRETRKTILFVTHSVDEAIFLASRVLIIGGRPGNLMEEVKVDLARPRDRTSAPFNEIKRHVFDLLMGKGQAAHAES